MNPALEEWTTTGDHICRLCRTGELSAVDVSVPGSSRPKYAIPTESVEDYERRHTFGTRQPAKRRKDELVELQDAP